MTASRREAALAQAAIFWAASGRPPTASKAPMVRNTAAASRIPSSRPAATASTPTAVTPTSAAPETSTESTALTAEASASRRWVAISLLSAARTRSSHCACRP